MSMKTPPASRGAPINATSGIPYGHVPAYLPGSASLVEELDKEVMLVLRDGRHLIGVSRFKEGCCCIFLLPSKI
jgi:hypothetical protein